MFSFKYFYTDILMLLPVNAIIPLLSRSVLLTGFPCRIVFHCFLCLALALFQKNIKMFLIWADQSLNYLDCSTSVSFYVLVFWLQGPWGLNCIPALEDKVL